MKTNVMRHRVLSLLISIVLASLASATSPTITTHPSSQTVVAGNSPTFSVTPAGTAPFTYQWLFSGVAVSGATSNTLTISNASLTNAGNYQVIVTNASGAVTSNAAFLAVKPSGVVHWWRGDDNALDSVGSGNGTVAGGLSYTTAKKARGFTFGSDTDHVNITNATDLNLQPGGFTCEFWMKGIKNQPQSLCLVIDKGHGLSGNNGWVFQCLDSSTGRLDFGAGNGTTFPSVTGIDVLDGNFHHVIGTWNGASLAYYIDGFPLGTSAFANPAGNTRDVSIGYWYPGARPFRGVVDEVLIYNRALTPAEVTSIYNADIASTMVNINYVTVGNAGNAADSTGYGAVSYSYKIGKSEVTISQYAEFLNAKAQADAYGLYNANMGSNLNIAGITRSGASGSYSYSVVAGSGNHPISYVSWFDAARFCNWMQNGQGGGSTETGAYTLNGAVSGIISRNAVATVWIPSEDEWYKAAYYDPNKGGAGVGGYWAQATQSDTITGNSIGVANSANYYDSDYVGSGTSSFPTANALTDVGAYGFNSESVYGTTDQAGNVWEWNDAVISGLSRGRRGGSWDNNPSLLPASYRLFNTPPEQGYDLGFRVASTVGAPQFASQPQSQTVIAGSNTTLSVTAAGTAPFTYQWLLNGLAILGATGSSLTFSSAAIANQGDYQVVVTNSYGSVTSAVSKLNVSLTPTHEVVASFPTTVGSTLGKTPIYVGTIRDTNGNLWGTTNAGGTHTNGTVFKITPTGVVSTVVDFTGTAGAAMGANPRSDLLLASDGNFYGTTTLGGANNFGTVFKLTPAGVLTTLVEFTGNGATNKGAGGSALVEYTDGMLYGVTDSGGASNSGTIFKVAKSGGPVTTLVQFAGTSIPRGSGSVGKLLLASDGKFYGMTYGGAQGHGTIYQMTPTGTLLTELEFTSTGAWPGSRPPGILSEGVDGFIYGGTQLGGTSDKGTLFKMGLGGTSFTSLYSFTGGADGADFTGNLVRLPDGLLYGATYDGGTTNNGTLFRTTTSGALTTLVTFAGSTAGAFAGMFPRNVSYQADGNLYGTTQSGGPLGGGTVYRLRFGPSPVTVAAASITATGAMINAMVNANGLTSSTFFEWGTSPTSLTNTATSSTIAPLTTPQSVAAFLTGLTPDTTYYFRSRAENPNQFQPQYGEVLSFTTLGVPEIVVEQPTGSNLIDGATTTNIGNIHLGNSSPSVLYTIRNTGTANLSGLAASKDGTNQADFIITQPGSATLAPGASTTFTVTFAPGAAGVRTAALHIASNDGDENPFDIALTGNGITSLPPNFTTSSTVPLTTNGFTATGLTVGAMTLGFDPAAGQVLTLVNNTSANPIGGAFSDLPNGGTTLTTYGGRSLLFIANYSGGDGNDLILTLLNPEIAVEQPVLTDIVDGGSKSFGTMVLGNPVSLGFTIKNTGAGLLNGLTITQSGTDQAEFSVTASPTAPVSGPAGTTAFTIQFNPATSGAKTAAIHIVSDDANENPFDITLTGQALSSSDDTDTDGLNDAAEFQLAALGYDWQVSQPALVNTLLTNANVAGLYTQMQLQALNVNTPLLTKSPATGKFKLTLGIEKSTNLTQFLAFPFTAPDTSINGQGKLEFEFAVPDNAAFFRLQAK